MLDRTRSRFWNIDGDTYYPKMSELLQWFYPNYRQKPSTLVQCFPALARIAVFTTALRRNEEALEVFLQHITSFDVDVQVAALKSIPEAWKYNWTLPRLCQAHMNSTQSPSHEIRTTTYNNVSTILDTSYTTANEVDKKQTCEILLTMAQNFIPALVDQPGRDEVCSDIKFGGWIALAMFNSTTISKADRDVFQRGPFLVWSVLLTCGASATSVSSHNINTIPSPNLANYHRILLNVFLWPLGSVHSTAT